MQERPRTEQLVLKPNVTWFVIGIVFFGGGGALLMPENKIVGCLSVAFGLVSFVILMWTVFSPRSRLRLTETGFSFGTMSRVSAFRWSDVAEFFPVYFGNRTWVCFRFSPSFRGERELRRINQEFGGFDRFLPFTYGMQADDLVRLMESWRSKYADLRA